MGAKRKEFTAFVDSIPDFEIVGDRVCYTAVGGGPEDYRCMPIAVFRVWHDAAGKVLEQWDGRDVAPIPIKRKR